MASKEEILKRIVGSAYFTTNEGATVLILQLDALSAMQEYANQELAEKEKECDELKFVVQELEQQIKRWIAYKQNIDQALNSGDGSYKP